MQKSPSPTATALKPLFLFQAATEISWYFLVCGEAKGAKKQRLLA